MRIFQLIELIMWHEFQIDALQTKDNKKKKKKKTKLTLLPPALVQYLLENPDKPGGSK